MGYLAQESSVFRKLTVEKNLLGMMELLGVGSKQRHRRCDELIQQFVKMFVCQLVKVVWKAKVMVCRKSHRL